MKAPCIYLYDVSGKMAAPWAEAGHRCLIVDLQHPAGLHPHPTLRNVWTLGVDLSRGFIPPQGWHGPYAFVAAFPPCDHLAVSGARWFVGKGLRALEWSIALFATAAEFCESSGAPYLIENPVSTISTYWRKPDYSFHPWHFAGLEPSDNYTKKTCLWTGGGFVMPMPVTSDLLGVPDDRIHKAPPGPDRHNFRSATPMGFSCATYEVNRPDARQAAA
jgi:hypothetical protein